VVHFLISDSWTTTALLLGAELSGALRIYYIKLELVQTERSSCRTEAAVLELINSTTQPVIQSQQQHS